MYKCIISQHAHIRHMIHIDGLQNLLITTDFEGKMEENGFIRYSAIKLHV